MLGTREDFILHDYTSSKKLKINEKNSFIRRYGPTWNQLVIFQTKKENYFVNVNKKNLKKSNLKFNKVSINLNSKKNY